MKSCSAEVRAEVRGRGVEPPLKDNNEGTESRYLLFEYYCDVLS